MSIFQNDNELLDIGNDSKRRAHVLDILEAGIESVLPHKAVKDFFESEGSTILPSRVFVCGWGKASLQMFDAFYNNYKGDIVSAHVVTLPQGEKANYGPRVSISHGSHPLPDESSISSGRKVLELAEELSEKDMFVCLISGGGSSMFEVPREGIGLEDLQDTYKMLIECGADIHEVNSVRRTLSASKGGGLAKAAYPAKVINLIISDVIGNNLEDIASGASVKDPFKIKPLEVIEKYGLDKKLQSRIIEIIKTYKPIEEKYFQNVNTYIIADNDRAQNAMIKKAASLGYNPTRFKGYITGEARFAVNSFMDTKGELIIGGGETTVTVKGTGKGGRNQEFVLAGLSNVKNGILASCGTDGIDGSTEAAGALGDNNVVEKSRVKQYDIDAYLKNNDSYEFFKDCGGLLITGPTGTNVADICVFLREVKNTS